MPIWLASNWKPLLIAAGVVLLYIGAYNHGSRVNQAEWDLAIAEATTKARQIESDNNILSNVIGGKYETGIKTIDDNYNAAIASIMQPASGNMPRTPKAACQPDAAARNNELYRKRKIERLNDAKEAELQAQRLLLLQEWQLGIK